MVHYKRRPMINSLESIKYSKNAMMKVFQKSKKIKTTHAIDIDGLISPEELDEGECLVFGRNVKPYDDPVFGKYCKFSVRIVVKERAEGTKKSKDIVTKKICITVHDKEGKTVIKRPPYFSELSEQDCVLFEWHGEGFYDCNRTYFHFEDDATRTSEGDFMHYKCRLIEIDLIELDE